jgi:tetratricopeptide (TPR) repeat protein
MIQDARRAVDSNPDDAAARHNLALAYKLGGMEELALHEFARVTELQPDFGDAYYEMALIQVRSGQREQALATLRRALAAEPGHSRAQRLLERLSNARRREDGN